MWTLWRGYEVDAFDLKKTGLWPVWSTHFREGRLRHHLKISCDMDPRHALVIEMQIGCSDVRGGCSPIAKYTLTNQLALQL